MRGLFLIFILFFLFLNSLWAKEPVPIDIRADTVNYYTERNLVVGEGNVKIFYEDIELYGDRVQANTLTKEVIAEGNVKIIEKDKNKTLKAQKIIYNLSTRRARVFSSHFESPPFYGWAKEFQKEKDLYKAKSAWISTCDLDKPHWRLQARRILIYPNKKVVAHNVVMYIGNIPVFFLPVYIQPVKEKTPHIGILPGKNKDWGIYILTWYRYHLNENARGKIYLDWRENKGFAQGVDLNIQNMPWGRMDSRFYYTDESGAINSQERYRVDLKYQYSPQDNFYITSEYHKFTDKSFLKDYFYREYEKQRQPQTYFYLNYLFNNASLSLEVKKRINDFFSVKEKLPELELSLYNLNFLKSIYYSMKGSAGYLDNRFQDSEFDEDTLRLHLGQELRYKKNIGVLNLSPYIVLDNTFYSQGPTREDIERFFWEGGVDNSLSFYRLYHLKKDKTLRHIIQPKLSFIYRGAPNFERERLYVFDDIETSEYYKGIALSLKNLFQIKREEEVETEGEIESKERVWNFLDIDLSTHYILGAKAQSKGFKDIELQTILNTGGPVFFKTDTVYSLEKDNLEESFNSLGIKLDDKFSFNIGYHYKYRGAETVASQIKLTGFKKWEFSYYTRYDVRDSKFDEHQFKIVRDLHCWLMDIIISVDDENHYAFYIGFRLKAFPKFGFNFETSYQGPKE